MQSVITGTQLRALARIAVILSAVFLFSAYLSAQSTAADLEPAGPWLSQDSGHFRFIYRERDRDFVRDLEACADEVFRTVTGFLLYAPRELVPVIIRGDQDNPAFGGVTGPFPLRIELVAGTRYSAKTLLQHEFTHYVNGTRPNGLFNIIGTVFGRDLNFVQTSFELHMVEGFTSFLDGDRISVANEVYYKAPIVEQRMWGEKDIWNGGDFQPGGLRVYVSQMIFCDYVHRHFGADALAKIQKKYAWFPFAGDSWAIRSITGMEPELIWSRAIKELADRFAADRDRPSGTVLTPQSANKQNQWRLLSQTERGFLMVRSSLDERPRIGFWIPPLEDPAASGPKLNKEAESGSWYPFADLGGSDYGASADAAGRRVVVALPEPDFDGDINHANFSDLWLYEPQPGPQGRTYQGQPRQLTHGAQLSNPCISPDGQRIFASQRVSDRFRLVEVNLKDGSVSVVLDLNDGSSTQRILEMALSPDGQKLAMRIDTNAASDIAVAAVPEPGETLGSSDLRWLTQDQAMEYQPRFMSDGNLVFSSDRENAIVLYLAYSEIGPFQRLLREPVAAWSGDLEAASYLKPDGSPQLVRPEGRPARFLYTTNTAEGRAVKRIDPGLMQPELMLDFAALLPDYRAKQAEKESVLQTQSPWDGQSAPTAEPKPLVDIALPRVWSPVLGLDLQGGFSMGLSTQAYSYLGQNNWNAQASYLYPANQLDASLAWNFLFPGLSIGISAAQDNGYKNAASGAPPTWYQQRQLQLSSAINLFEIWNPSDFRSSLDLSLAGAADWEASRASSFDLVEGYGIPAEFKVMAQAGLSWMAWTPSPRTAVFGGSVLQAKLDMVALPWDSRLGSVGGLADLALRAGLEGRLPFQNSYFGLRLRTAWAQSGNAAAYLDQLGASWLVVQAPLRFDLRADLALSDQLQPGNRFLYWLPMEQSGLRLLMQSGAGLDSAGQLFWDGKVQLGLEFTIKPLLYYNVIPLNFGIGANLGIAAGAASFDPARDLSFWIGINGQKFSY